MQPEADGLGLVDAVVVENQHDPLRAPIVAA
jgi:hypothetical protein